MAYMIKYPEYFLLSLYQFLKGYKEKAVKGLNRPIFDITCYVMTCDHSENLDSTKKVRAKVIGKVAEVCTKG